MILKVNRLDFLKKIKIVSKAISDNKIRPIISYVYMETKDNKLCFCGTNLELTITTDMNVEIIKSGKAVFQHNLVEEYLKEIKDEIITIDINDNIMLIESADSSSEFLLMNAEEYPKVQEIVLKTEELNFKLKKLDLANYFDKVRFSASLSNDNLSINCIRFEIENRKMRFVSTDTYRLTYLELDYENDGNFSVSIPLNTIDAISKLLRNGEEQEIAFTLKNNQLYLQLGDISIQSRVIDLPFPNYKTILTAGGYNKKLTINRVEFEKMLKRIQIFVKNNVESKFGAIFTMINKDMNIEGIGDIAKAKEIIDADYIGEDLKISLNVKFLLEFIQSSTKETITLEFTNSNSAVRVRDIDEENYTYIVMPLALKN